MNRVAFSHPSFGKKSNDEMFMDAEFEHTKSLCTNEAQKAVVTAARAEYYLAQGRVELAAKYLAQSPTSIAPFTETAIRLALPSLMGEGCNATRETKKST
jgi:hypothetical protein